MYLPKALSIWVMLLLLDKCQTIKVEIDLGGTRSKQVRLICMPTDEFQGKNKNTILWEGLKFGVSERDTLAASLKDRDLVPNIKVNSSRFKCFLESRNLDGESELSKKARSNRELAAGNK
ncbi:hypothetical protein TNCT_332251 [Trichonephila clavata]|uniref:Uncharacterized protein n=1 Tax=Trichonephila clavata TaxID=2740835 RepID=A0A8X6LZV5_TRICU|nr:hypothetical protein TNCT_332251 [Trichonephila clavata]